MRRLEYNDIVLRGLIRSTHIDREHQSILAVAFMLRTLPDGTKEESLSVSHDCSPVECASGFNKCYGVASLHVGPIRGLGLDVVPDEPHHANIVGLPHKDDDLAKAEYLAGRLQRQATLELIQQIAVAICVLDARIAELTRLTSMLPDPDDSEKYGENS